ncbi:MAG: PEP-CTERM sorting domain-containing protein [Pirellulales bacterium]|nr:PEP-CTERM sorting domain-containing protein [Pirellulales bacterium]
MKQIIALMLTYVFLLSVSTAQAAITESGSVYPSPVATTWNGYTGTDARLGIATAGYTPGVVTLDDGSDIAFGTGAALGVGWNIPDVGGQPGGTLTLDGDNASDATTLSVSLLRVGYSQKGVVNVDGNATLTVGSSGAYLGAAAGGNGTLNITGGGTVTLSGRLNIAYASSTGALVVGTEGSTGPTCTLNAVDIEVSRADSTGSITVWDDGLINTTANIRLGRFGDAISSSLLVSGGTLQTSDVVYGYNSTSDIIVRDGGLIDSAGGVLGNSSGTVLSAATVEGEGSQWISDSMVVGGGGKGSLLLYDGGELVTETLVIDYDYGTGPTDSRIDMKGGKITLPGDLSDLATFMAAVQGSDEIYVLDQSTYALIHVNSATLGDDYTLTYNSGDDTTTLASTTVPEPSTLILLLGVVFAGLILRKK